MIRASALLSLCVGLMSCASEQPKVIPEVVAPDTEFHADWDAKPDGKVWTRLTRDAIDEVGGALLTSDVSDMDRFCPGYDGQTADGKTAFWVGLISAMSRLESGHDPSVSYTENFQTADGRDVVSRGLLQLSQESANGYAGCLVPVADEARLHEPALNLRCGVIILTRWVSRDGVIADESTPYLGGARYWSVLRNAGKIDQIAGYTRSLKVCGG